MPTTQTKSNPFIDYIRKGIVDIKAGVRSVPALKVSKIFPADSVALMDKFTVATSAYKGELRLDPGNVHEVVIPRTTTTPLPNAKPLRKYYQVTVDRTYCKDETDPELGNDDDIFASWVCLPAGQPPRGGKTSTLTMNDTDKRTRSFGGSKVLYEGVAVPIVCEVDLWEEDDAEMARKLQNLVDTVNEIWNEEILPTLGEAGTAGDCAQLLAAWWSGAEPPEGAGDRCLTWLASMVDEVLQFLVDALGLSDDYIGRKTMALDLPAWRDIDVGAAQDVELPLFKGQGGEYKVYLKVTRVGYPKAVLSDSSQGSPSITAGPYGLGLAWRGNGNMLINVATMDFPTLTSKMTLTHKSMQAPVTHQCIAKPERRLLFWQDHPTRNLKVASSDNGGTWRVIEDMSHSPYSTDLLAVAEVSRGIYLGASFFGGGKPTVSFLVSKDHGQSWSAKVDVPELAWGLALAGFKDRIIVAWRGTDANNSLNVAEFDGSSALKQKITLSESTHYRPALAVHEGRLYLAWVGIDKRLNVMSSTDGKTFSDKKTLSETSSQGVSLAEHLGTLCIAWIGTDTNRSINILPLD